jgi:transposase
MVRETRKKWAELVARWGRSGLTANQFAGEAKINAGTLQFYKWLLGRDSRFAPRKRPRLKTGMGFVEVRTDDLAKPEVSRADDRIEVVLASGTRVVVSSGFDAGAFRKVVAALEAPR